MKVTVSSFLLVLAVILFLPENLYAGQHGKTEVRAWVAHHTDMEKAAAIHETPFMLACALGDIGMMHFFMLHGADPNETDKNGNTALHYAVDHGRVSAVKLLLEIGADYRKKNRDGFTPLALTQRKQSPATKEENRAIAKMIRMRMAHHKRHKHRVTSGQ